MKTFFRLSVLCIWIACFSCQAPVLQKERAKDADRLDLKHEPFEEFFQLRSYPDETFDITAYSKAMHIAKEQSLSLQKVNGFDEEWTVEGPGNIGARVNVVAVHPNDEATMLAGFSAGGIFKTTNYGASWYPVFDDQVFLATGSIVYDPVDPDIVYAGTGDPNISGHPFIGDGIYKSTDGGESWTHKGLTEQRIVSRIKINPNNNQIVFAACMGLPFERNDERGLYRSTNGGDTWEQVLFLSDEAGVIDLLMDTSNPDILYAAGWNRIRNNTESMVNGNEARIHKTTDGGDTWTMLEGGLPNFEHSRMGLAMSGSDPNHIFAMYVNTSQRLESIFQSFDGGMNWIEVPSLFYNDDGEEIDPLAGFGWYFGQIRVNPNNSEDLFMLGVELWRTLDGGQNWEIANPPWWQYEVHADKHDVVFTNDSMIVATDGGIYKTYLSDDFNTYNYRDLENIPTTQFYRVAYNPHDTDKVYGGAQDNGSTGGNAAQINDWPRIYGGDGFQMAFHPDNSNYVFAETQNGNILASDDGGNFSWFSITDGIDPDDRQNWDMPYFISPHNPDKMYTGTYRVYESVGSPYANWFPISDDVTDGIILEARFHTITCINESPVSAGFLYVGTVDGNVTVTANGGNSWTNVSAGLPERYVTDVEGSGVEEERFYVSHSGYKDNDFIPHIHRTDDLGANWTDISGDLPPLAVNSLFVLPEHQDSILFAGTDGGVYATINSGQNWERLGTNMPYIAVYDLDWNEAKNELIAGTFGRSIMTYPIDSLITEPIMVATSKPTTSLDYDFMDVYPNPVADQLNIRFGKIEAGKDGALVIVNSTGQLLYEQELDATLGSADLSIDVSDYPAGQYFVKVKIRHRVLTEAFVKMK